MSIAHALTGSELKRMRESAGVTRAELARAAGVSVPAVHSIEKAEAVRLDTFSRYTVAIQRLAAANETGKVILAISLLEAALTLFRSIHDLPTESETDQITRRAQE
ncbi:MAG: helix-turn-helix domain-containing protein [Candidatus Dormibacteraceae bacterium]